MLLLSVCLSPAALLPAADRPLLVSASPRAVLVAHFLLSLPNGALPPARVPSPAPPKAGGAPTRAPPQMSAKEDGSLEEGEVDAALLSSSNKEGDEEHSDDSSSTTTSGSSSQEAPTRAKKQKRKQAMYPELDPKHRLNEKFD